MVKFNANCSHWPDFFLIGAPKSGTSSLAAYLADHPQISFSQVKEPHYFATDLSTAPHRLSEQEYLALFPKKSDGCLRGEGSTGYLFSEMAVPNILQRTPNAKFVVMLRNPVEAAYAYHGERLKNCNEDIIDFEAAWGLQEERKKGFSIPDTCFEPKLLQYRDIFLYGNLLERLFSWVPREQVHVILFEDFRDDVRATYRKLLQFLGLSDDGRNSFPVHHQSLRIRSTFLNRFIRRPHPWVKCIVAPLKIIAG